MGLLVSLLFSLVPLLEVRRVKPLLLLRALDSQGAPVGQPDRGTPVPGVLDSAWVRRAPTDWRRCVRHGGARGRRRLAGGVAPVALIVCGGFAGISLVLHGVALVVRAVRPLAAAPVSAAARRRQPAPARATRPG